MEAKGRAISAMFRRSSCLLFCCVVFPLIVIDESGYRGLTDLYFNRTSSATSHADIVLVDLLDNASVLPDEEIQMSFFSGAGCLDIQFFSNLSEWIPATVSLQFFFSNLSEWIPATVCLLSYLIMVTLLVLFLYQNGQVSSLQTELKQLVVVNENKKFLVSQLQTTLECQKSNLTASTYKISKLNKRLSKVESDLVKENEEFEDMHDYLKEWKMEWIQESDKLRQINPDYLKPSTENSPSPSSIQRYVDQQNQEIQKYIDHAHKQFEKIQKSLQADGESIRDAFDHLDFMQEVLNEKGYESLC